MSLCCTIVYKWVTVVMDGIKFECVKLTYPCIRKTILIGDEFSVLDILYNINYIILKKNVGTYKINSKLIKLDSLCYVEPCIKF